MAASTAGPVDLVALRRACRSIIGCYEHYLSEGRLAVHELDEALANLRQLPHVGGRLGQAVALLVAGGAGAASEETLAALELLRTTSGLRLSEVQPPPVPPAPSAADQRSRRRRGRPRRSESGGWLQPHLPGLD